jgi:hypothetical protein
MPFISAMNGEYGFGRALATTTTPTTPAGIPFEQLNTIATYLRNYMSDFRNPSFYSYQLDGNGFFINDGGSDMYDNGNVTTPWLRSGTTYVGNGGYSAAAYPSAINYTNTTRTLMDTDFYYISLGYVQFVAPTQDITRHPLTVIGSRSSTGQPVGWQVGGNSGADGGGTLASGLVYNGSVIQGFTVYAFYRETYNAGDPSHCNLFILLGHPNWSSTFGTITTFADPVSNGGCGSYLYTSGAGVKNILSIQTLLSKSGGTLVTSAECQTVTQNFITRIKEAIGF